MNVILFDTDRENLYPLSLTRPISDFRVGILTIKEKWELFYKICICIDRGLFNRKVSL